MSNGKGSKRRPCKNYSQYLENWDKAFDFDEMNLKLDEFVSNRFNNKQFKTICSHSVSPNLTCKFCGQSTSEILSSGDSYTQENL